MSTGLVSLPPLQPASALQDFERVLVFLLVLEKAGGASGIGTGRADDVDLFCRISGWSETRAAAAFRAAQEHRIRLCA